MGGAAPALPLPADLAAATAEVLGGLPVQDLPRGAVLFRAGDPAAGFLLLLSGKVEVFLTGPSGREILLYAVAPGQSCVQTTLGLLGDEPYTGEALVAAPTRTLLVPKGLFLRLMDADPAFRRFVLHSFAQRMQDVTHLLERVAFSRVESRLAEALLALAEGDVVSATQAELAARIGSAREVVTRRLDALARQGLLRPERGAVHLLDRKALARLAAGAEAL
jgi:CRP/FNR family transcriptional regulator